MIDFELPTKITEIIGIITILGTCIALTYKTAKNYHLFIDRITSKIEYLMKKVEGIEKKVDSNEKHAKIAFEKVNESITEIKISTAKQEAALDFIQESMRCQNSARGL